MAERTILLKVELDAGQLKKSAKEAETELAKLTPQLKALRDEGKQNTLEYKTLQVEIQKYNKQLTDNAKAIQINERQLKSNAGSMNQMKDQMLAAKIALGQMTEEMRKSEEGQNLVKEIDAINEALKEQEAEFGQFGRNVGNYAGTLAEMKAELKALKGEMATLDAGSAQYQEASEKAGQLGDKIKEVNENVKASSGGTGFEKMSNNLSLVKGDLENLDFEGVAEKMKQMAVISQQMTFKEALGGLKNMGSSLISLGKTILVNPLFLMAATIIGVTKALIDFSTASDAKALASQERLTASLERGTNALQQQERAIRDNGEMRLRMARAMGASDEQLHKIRLETIDKANKKELDQLESLGKEKENQKNIINKNLAVLDEWWGSQAEEDEAQRQIDEAKATLKTKREQYDALNYEHNKNLAERNVIDAEFQAEQRAKEKQDADERLQDGKDAAEKRRAAAQEDYAKRVALERKFRDEMLKGVDLSISNEEKAIEAKYKFLTDTAEGNIDELLQIEAEKNQELLALDEKAKTQELARIAENYKREREEAEKNKKIIAELDKNEALERESIELDFQAKADDRAITHNNAIETHQLQRVEATRKATQDIAMLEAELEVLTATTVDEQKTAWQNLQNVRVSTLEQTRDIELQNESLTSQERIRITKETELEITRIKEEEFNARQEKLEPLINENIAKEATYALNSAQQLSDSLFQIKQNQLQKELNAVQEKYEEESSLLKDQLDANIISQTEYDAKKSALDAEAQAKEKKLKEQQFKSQKTSQLISAAINTAVAVTAALGIPGAGIALAAVSAALGAAQIAIIASQPTPKFAKGGAPIQSGTFGGKSHSNGGTKGVFDDGTQIEVEKDENFYILNKKSSAMINRLSHLNQMGGGIPLAKHGAVMKFATGGAFASQSTNGVDSRLNQENSIVEYISKMPRPVVLVEDINGAQGTLSDVESRANW